MNMKRVGPEGLGPVFRLVYRSRATIAVGHREDQLDEILGISRLKNAGADVTGALLTWQDAFVQVLEGEEPDVRALYDTIQADPRHEQVMTLDADTVPERVFGRWSMARIGDDDGVDISLSMDRRVGPAEPAALRTGDPAQDRMLTLMREYALVDAGPPP